MEEIKNLLKSLGVETEDIFIFRHQTGAYIAYFEKKYMLSNTFFETLGKSYCYTLWYGEERDQIGLMLMKKI